jgi:hypothetical protein
MGEVPLYGARGVLRMEFLRRSTYTAPPRASYRGTSLIRPPPPVGPYTRTMSRAVWWSQGGVPFLMSEVPM